MKKKTRNIIMVLAVAAVLIVGSVCAYFTDTDTATNKFIVGEVDITLSEPTFDETNGEDMYAGKVIAKDPKVTSNGINDAYVYLKVKVPKANVITAAEDGTKQPQAVTQLFSYSVAADSQWSLIESDTSAADYNEYVYAYNTILSKGDVTVPLFTQVTFANLIEGQIPATTELDVIVDAYAIQSDFATAKTAAEAWEIYCTQNA